MLPLIAAQTVAFGSRFGGWILRGRPAVTLLALRAAIGLSSTSRLRHAHIDQQLRHRDRRLRRPLFRLLAGDVDAFHEQQQGVAEHGGVTRSHDSGELAQALANHFLVRFGDPPRGIVPRRIFHGGVAEATAAIAFAHGARGQPTNVSEHVLTRIAVGFSAGLFEFLPEVQFIVAHIGGGEIVLGREAAIEARLGDAGPVNHLVDADSADALAIEQLARGGADPVGGPGGTFRRWINCFLHDDFSGSSRTACLTMLLTGTYTYRIVTRTGK